MMRSRTARYVLALLLLSAVYAGVYLYRHTPQLLQEQAQQLLQQYGVREFDYQGLALGLGDASVATLSLQGDYAGVTYQVSLTSMALQFDWRALLLGHIQSLSIASVTITVDQQATNDSQSDSGRINVEDLMPRQLLAQLPVDELTIDHWHIDYQAPNLPALSIDGALTIAETIDLQLTTAVAGAVIDARLRSALSDTLALELTLNKPGAQFVTLSANLARADDDGWDWQIAGELQYAPLLAWLRDLDTLQTLALALPSPDTLTLTGTTTFTVRLHHPNDIDLSAAPGSRQALLQQLTANAALTNTIQQLDIADLITAANGTFDIQVDLGSETTVVTLQPSVFTARLHADLLALPERWTLGQDHIPLVVETTEPLTVMTQDSSANWSAKMRNSSVLLGVDDTQLSVEQLSLDLSARTAATAGPRLTTAISAQLFSRLQQQTLPPVQLAFKQQGSLAQSTIELHIEDVPNSLQATLTGALDLEATTVNGHLSAQIDDFSALTTKAAPLLRHFKLLEDELHIDTGTLQVDTSFNGTDFDSANWQQTSHLTLHKLSGNFNDYTFEDLALIARWEGVTHWKTLQPVEISLGVLNVGFAVRDARLHLSLPKATPIAAPELRIDRFVADMFDGRLLMPTTQTQGWDFAAATNHLTLRAQDWQLRELVALQQSDDIDANGTLEGEFPVTISDGRIIIEDGYLRALPPGGSIRYTPNDEGQALANSSSELAMALDLLSDFQYQQLTSEVQLDKAGNLLLGLSLAGSNPAQYEGQAIQFNINLEQNIDPLLQSLRLSDNLVKQIESGLN